MSSTLFSQPRVREFTPSGTVLSGAKLYFYVSGTSTLATLYSDSALAVTRANPVVADTGGLFPAIWLDESVVYDVTLTTSAEVEQWNETGILTQSEDELILTSAQTAEPFSNVFIRFKEPGGDTKGWVGFTAPGDNTMSMTSNEDHRLKFRTGTPGDDSTFIDRCFMYGSATASWLGIMANTALGGCFVRFTTQDSSVTKGYVGFASTSDDDIDIINSMPGGHIELTTTGTGRIFLPLTGGSAAAPMLAVTGDPDTGLFSRVANEVNVAAGGVEILRMSPTDVAVRAGTLTLPVTGTASAPDLTFNGDADTGIYRSAINALSVAAGGIAIATFKGDGSVNFQALAAAPASPVDGDVYYDATLVKLRVRAGGAWVNLH